MKKLILFTILLFISEILFAQSFSGGTGTENDPFIIANAQDLMDLSNLSTGKGYLNKCYKLENDIQLTTINLMNLVEHLTVMGKQFTI